MGIVHGRAGKGQLHVEEKGLEEAARLAEEGVVGRDVVDAGVASDGASKPVLGHVRHGDPVGRQGEGEGGLVEERVGGAEDEVLGDDVVAQPPVLEEGHVVVQVVADGGLVDAGDDAVAAQLGRVADAREEQQLRRADGAGAEDDGRGRQEDGPVGQLDAAGPGLPAVRLGLEDHPLHHDARLHVHAGQVVLRGCRLAPAVASALAEAGQPDVVAVVVLAARKRDHAHLRPGLAHDPGQRKLPARRQHRRDVHGTALAVLLRTAVVEPVLRPPKVRQQPVVRPSGIASGCLRPLGIVGRASTHPRPRVDGRAAPQTPALVVDYATAPQRCHRLGPVLPVQVAAQVQRLQLQDVGPAACVWAGLE